MKKTSITKIFYGILTLGILLGCSGKTTSHPDSENDIANSDTTAYRTEAIRQIFYNVPSPLEMANLIEKSKAVFNPQLLSQHGREKEFLTQDFQALNLGVYGADMSYCRVFDQIQESIKYLSSIRNLTIALQIPDNQSSIAVERLEKNLTNRDSLINVSIDLFSEADAYLKENNREGTAVLILIGSWIEGMYLSTQLITDIKRQEALLEKIASQKISNQHLIALLEPFHLETPIRRELYQRLNKLKEIFSNVKETSTQTKTMNNPQEGKTVLHSGNLHEIDQETFIKLQKELEIIRTFIIKR